jgi:hypothetical protein
MFGAEMTSSRLETIMAPRKKDLPASKPVKGGGLTPNDNLTLIRAAKPTKKDLPAINVVKGGSYSWGVSKTR